MAHSSGLTPLPPTIHHSSKPVTHSSAYAILSSFLSVAELDPSLRPDSVLSERGPTSSSSAANPNLTLAHLGRIAKGMRGERVGGGADDDFDDVGFGGNLWGARKRKRTEQQPETPRKGKKGPVAAMQDVEIVEDGPDAGEFALVATSPAQGEDEWQDRENYDLAQDDDEVDVGNAQRNPSIGTGVEEATEMEELDEEAVDARVVDLRTTRGEAERDQKVAHENKLDKAERKRLKKERSKKEKKTARAR
jgi:hypothetical protein